MKVDVEVKFTTLVNENEIEVPGVIAVCDRCGHTTESFGTGENSIKRCLVLLREECPEDEKNFYVDYEG